MMKSKLMPDSLIMIIDDGSASMIQANAGLVLVKGNEVSGVVRRSAALFVGFQEQAVMQ
jgi:hypothetical protein